MANPVELAKLARTTLAQALEALQSTPETPEALMDIAEPIARTMGVLHRIEKSGGATAEQCSEALDNVRGALDLLQSAPAHEAVDAAMEAVAGSLSKLFALSKSVTPSSPPLGQGTVKMDPSIEDDIDLQATIPIQSKPRAARVEASAPVQAAPKPMVEAPTQPIPEPVAHAVGDPRGLRVPGMTDAPVPASGIQHVDVELGAHSSSNFYKGLSGNDVVDHGGIFVATYTIPKIGTPVALRVLFPGDLEFSGDAMVQWTREPRSGESDPGFGAKFTRITQEGRELIHRYVRNREPMFYDDL